jgi:heterodisulfide reductase subunit B
LCQFNLDRWQRDLVVKKGGFRPLPVLYFTQLLAIALGLDPTRYELEKHYVDPKPLLKAKGLLDQEVG